MLNKTEKRQLARFFVITIILIIFIILVLSFKLISIESKEMYSYILTISSVMGGFMFAGLGILFSAITTNSIKRFWDGHYLDNLYRVSVAGLLSDIISMFIATIILYTNTATVTNILSKLTIVDPEIVMAKIKTVLEWADIVFAWLGLAYFIWSVIVLLKIFEILKKSKF